MSSNLRFSSYEEALERLPAMRYESLVVRCELAAPVALDRWEPLDGLLGWAVAFFPDLREESRARRWAIREAHNRGIRPDYDRIGNFIPLATWGHGVVPKRWVYCSSYAFPEGETPWDTAYWTKRFDAEAAARWLDPQARKQKVNVRSGPLRSYHMPLPVRSVRALVWHVYGDARELRKILVRIRGIGKKRAYGFGKVKAWSVEPEPDGLDRSVFDPEGTLMRPLPMDLVEAAGIKGQFEVGYFAYRPPYWDSRYFDRCAILGRADDPPDLRQGLRKSPPSSPQKAICEIESLEDILKEAFVV